MNAKNTTTAAAVVPSLESFTDTIIDRAAKGDAASRAVLRDTTGKALALAFSALLTGICQKQRTTLATLIGSVSDADIVHLKRTLPKDSPQYAALTTAIKEAKRSANSVPVVSTVAPGEMFYKSKGTYNANPMLSVKLTGETGYRFSETHEAAFWSCLLTVIANPEALAMIRQFVSDNPPAVK